MKELDVILAEAGRLKELLAVAEKLKELGSLDEALAERRNALLEAERRRDEAVTAANNSRDLAKKAIDGLVEERKAHEMKLAEQLASLKGQAMGIITEARAEGQRIIETSRGEGEQIKAGIVAEMQSAQRDLVGLKADLAALDVVLGGKRDELASVQKHILTVRTAAEEMLKVGQ